MKKETLFLCLAWIIQPAALSFAHSAARSSAPFAVSSSAHFSVSSFADCYCKRPTRMAGASKISRPFRRTAGALLSWVPVRLPLLLPPEPIHYKVIAAAGHSFGYDIYSNGKILVHQVSIPGLPGNQGFTRRKDAEKVAALVVKKLEKNIMPPTVTRAEMDELKVKY